jgi:uncharacterized heparinase superfamily protein
LSLVERIGRTARTVRHLRPRQAGAQIWHALRGVGRPASWAGPAPGLAVERCDVAFLPAPAHARVDAGRRVTLIGASVDFGDRIDWDFTGAGPLFAYHLHQLDFLRDPALEPAVRLELVLDWIRRHRGGVGWDPHPTSLRILTLGKLLVSDGALPPDEAARGEIRHSLARQVETLSRNVEHRLQANHLLSNLIGVVFGGWLLAGPHAERWRAAGPRLVDELGRQIRPDGLHEERSPMYHALLLESLLDLLNLVRSVGSPDARSLADALVPAAARMRGALALLTHPDGEIALFADSAFGIAQAPVRLGAYADALGVPAATTVGPGLLPQSGYVRLEAGAFTLIASVGGPSPPHQPGHAHCDALAFELSCGDHRVVTDTGVYEYVPGERRRIARATASHATIQIDGTEQAEVWAAHRVGGRPRVVLESVRPGVRAVASACGWSTPDTVHRRTFRTQDAAIEIQDVIEGRVRPVRLALPLAPGLEPRLAHDRDGGTEAHVRLATGARLRMALPVAARWRIERAPYYPEFGHAVERACLVGEADTFDTGTWRFERVD